jgi:hypothetical protein
MAASPRWGVLFSPGAVNCNVGTAPRAAEKKSVSVEEALVKVNSLPSRLALEYGLLARTRVTR